MRYLIASDIYGRTHALLELANKLEGSVEIFDPYDAENMGFENESEAYDYFTLHIGLDKYTENLLSKIRSYAEKTCLIGFSVGASAIWKVSANNDLKHVSKAVCFYGSQIRNEINIQTTFPVQLIFPTSEKHFSISKLTAELSNRKNIEVVKSEYLHGFMNKHSENYNQSAYDEYIELLKANI